MTLYINILTGITKHHILNFNIMKTINFESLKTFTLLIVISILIVILLFKQCNTDPEYTEIIDTVKITTVKTNLVPVAVSYPVKSEVEKIIYKKVYLTKDSFIFVIDSAKIHEYIKEYLAENFYKETIQNDSIAKIILDITIQKNKIKELKSDVEVYSYKTTLKPVFIVYGGVYYLNMQNISSVGLNAGIIKNNNIYEASIGTNKTYLAKYSRIFYTKYK